MNLSDWMAREGLNLTDGALRLGLPVTTLHGYLNGRRTPTLARCAEIERITKGEVRANDFVPRVGQESASHRGGVQSETDADSTAASSETVPAIDGAELRA